VRFNRFSTYEVEKRVEVRYDWNMAQYRKEPLVTDQYYHVYSRSIAKFVIFNEDGEYDRFYQLLSAYRHVEFDYRYSQFLKNSKARQVEILNNIASRDNCLVGIVAYCLMPTHIHLLLKQTKDKGVAKFIARVLNGYTRYFNTKHQRIGPLWSGRFKSVRVDADEQLLHVTRYIHLNPTSANLVDTPQDWPYSSYKEYLGRAEMPQICRFKDVIDIGAKEYRSLVNDHQGYQRDLALVKRLIIEDYSG